MICDLAEGGCGAREGDEEGDFGVTVVPSLVNLEFEKGRKTGRVM